MGVPIKEPKTPPLDMVNVPPAISSRDILFSRPLLANTMRFFSNSAKLCDSQFLKTGTINPLGVATATDISM